MSSLQPSPKTVFCPQAARLSRPTKVQACHLQRLALVYVRQSTPHQVIDNRESTDRQYALVQRAVDLGWDVPRVEVIDEDQGKSGSSAAGRLGFQKMLAEVGLDHVGIILGLEMSRLARSCKDWHQLLELCAIFRTLLADQDGLYDPTDYNDRLLLGLKGTMSEAELHILKGRMNAGRLNKARRGELLALAPIGYLKMPTKEFVIDPDEQVQAVVRMVFDLFDRFGCVRGVLRYLIDQGIRIGVRPSYGPKRGSLEWRYPTRHAVQNIITNPIYAGIYRYGYRQIDPRRKKPGQRGSGRVLVTADECLAFIPDRMPAYITLERYQANQQQLAANRARYEALGAPRRGQSLLGGLLFCGRCGRRMAVHYTGKSQSLRYECWSAKQDRPDGCRCVGLAGRVLDELIAEQMLIALQPAALELSLAAADDVQQERDRLTENWQQRLERARYQTERAERQFEAVEPENRLVARELERRWEAELKEQRQLEAEYEQFRRTQPLELSAEERARILALARDLPAIWHATATTPADRKRIVRLVLSRVVVTIQDASDRVAVALEWAGGFTSQHEVTRPVQAYAQKGDFSRLLTRVRELHEAGNSATEIATVLNREGFHPFKPGDAFDQRRVAHLLAKYVSGGSRKSHEAITARLGRHEWLVKDLAAKVPMSTTNLYRWLKLGWIHYRHLTGYPQTFVCWADADEIKRFRKLRHARRGWWDPPPPKELTTPKLRPAVDK
jgi:DNA invertase Pin-like site-specific DNA recombinase